jgi:signal peptidase II
MADSTRSLITRTTWIWAVVVAVVAVVSDQASKAWARSALAGDIERPIVGELLSLRLVHNSGAAFSFGADRTWVLTVFTLIIMCFLAVLAIRVRRPFSLLAIATLMGGAVGNLIDRLTADPGFGVGHVTDFIAYGTWFVGNVADIWIVLGAALLAVALGREPREEEGK